MSGYSTRLDKLERAMAAFGAKPRRSHRIIVDGVDEQTARQNYERTHCKIGKGETVVIRRIIDPVKAVIA